ncbi:MAG: hypothetical protein LUC37_03930 [Prevotella sp.]|nr:hypothetical protein [Prevotella sp.]
MKRQGILILFSLLVVFSWGQTTGVKSAFKSVFLLTTFDSDNQVLSTGHGAFITSDGQAVSNLKPFLGCARAEVTDTKGKTYEVSRIIGANELYDVAFFTVNQKVTPCLIAPSNLSIGSNVWMIPYEKKLTDLTASTIKSVETFMDKYSYYIISMTSLEDIDGSPFVNDDGQLVGLASSSSKGDVHLTDANFISSLQTSGLSFNDHSISQIGIAPALPKDKDQALLMLMMLDSNVDPKIKSTVVNDFIASYPTMVDGYSSRAQANVALGDFSSAAKDMETAIQKADKKDEAHYAYSQVIYNKEVFDPDTPYKDWTLDKALSEAEKAYEINPQNIYELQKARIKFAMGDYQNAYEEYIPLAKSTPNSGEIYYEASLCKQMLDAPAMEVIALLDSAIANTDTMAIRQAAPYFFSRAEIYNSVDSFRQAVFDYTRYEILVDGQVNSEFYYLREQAEVKARLYQQALVDITHAIYLSQDEPMYYAEKASLELKVNMFDEALNTATKCIEVDPEYATGYLLLGLAQLQKDQKTEALKNVEKAKELGDEQAQGIIDKYFK